MYKRQRPEFAQLLEEYGFNGMQLKFEVNIPSSIPWQSCALQVMFTGNDVVTYATGTNAYFSDTNVPRGLWLPWKNTGSYDTGGKWTDVYKRQSRVCSIAVCLRMKCTILPWVREPRLSMQVLEARLWHLSLHV